MKKWIAAMISAVCVLALTACGSSLQETKPTEAMVSIANPYGTYESAEKMQQAANLEVQLPDQLPSWVTETIYRAIPGELAEIIYQGADNEIRVRIKKGDQDISGVYDTAAREEKDVSLGENSVHLKGETRDSDSFTVFVATWFTAEGRTYSVTSPQGVPESVMLEMIQQVR